MSMFSTAMFLETMENLQKNLHQNSVDHGFWEEVDNTSVPTKLCLIHSEVSEALESYRKGNPPCEKTYPSSLNSEPVKLDISSIAEEMADVVIRVMDLCEHLHIDLGRAILAKADYNRNRPFQHGGKKC